jgi:CDP-diacylglycerol pyrophosphatase
MPAPPVATRVAVLVLLLLAAGLGRAGASDPDALWKIVHERCVPDQIAHDDPAPCAKVVLTPDEAKGWVVLKDRDGAEQFLVIPTAKITGIEDRAILAPDATNYFRAAWAARGDMLAKLGRDLPRDDISLAINSPFGRSQNQLHIHIDCIRADVRDVLRARQAEIGQHWAPLGTTLAGHPYSARRIDDADLDAANPFWLLAAEEGIGAAGIGEHTLVVVGASFADGHDGFVALDDHYDAASGDRASGEELQDHGCGLAPAPAR